MNLFVGLNPSIKPISFLKWVSFVIPLGVFHEPIFWAQSKHKTQTAKQFFGFLFFSNLSKCILNVIKNKKPISFWK